MNSCFNSLVVEKGIKKEKTLNTKKKFIINDVEKPGVQNAN